MFNQNQNLKVLQVKAYETKKHVVDAGRQANEAIETVICLNQIFTILAVLHRSVERVAGPISAA